MIITKPKHKSNMFYNNHSYTSLITNRFGDTSKCRDRCTKHGRHKDRSFRHQIHELVPLVSEASVVVGAEMGNENLVCNLSDLLDQSTQVGSFDIIWHRVDHGAQLAASTVRDLLEQLGPMALLEGVVSCLKHHRRISSE